MINGGVRQPLLNLNFMTKFICDTCKKESNCTEVDGDKLFPYEWISCSLNEYSNKTKEGTLRKAHNFFDLHFCFSILIYTFVLNGVEAVLKTLFKPL